MSSKFCPRHSSTQATAGREFSHLLKPALSLLTPIFHSHLNTIAWHSQSVFFRPLIAPCLGCLDPCPVILVVSSLSPSGHPLNPTFPHLCPVLKFCHIIRVFTTKAQQSRYGFLTQICIFSEKLFQRKSF